MPVAAAQDIEGWLELEGDPLEVDNRRYFVRRAAKQRRVLLLSSGDSDDVRPAARFLASALPAASDLPWRLESQSWDEAEDALLNVYA